MADTNDISELLARVAALEAILDELKTVQARSVVNGSTLWRTGAIPTAYLPGD